MGSKFLELTQFAGGELTVWEERQEGYEYIVACDPSLGRTWSEKPDHSSVGVWKRIGHKEIEEVAELYTQRPAGRVGQAIACLGRYYGGWVDPKGAEHNCALLNIERNLMDAPLFGVQSLGYPEDRLFCETRRDHQTQSVIKIYFSAMMSNTRHYLVQNLIDYIDRGAVRIRCAETLREIRQLEKDDKGITATRGMDRAVMTMLACAADQESPPTEQWEAKPEEVKEPPWGVDPVLWRASHGIKKQRVITAFMDNTRWEPTRG